MPGQYYMCHYSCSKCTISCYEGVGYYTFPLDHSVLVRSDILTLGLPWGHVGVRVADMCSGYAGDNKHDNSSVWLDYL